MDCAHMAAIVELEGAAMAKAPQPTRARVAPSRADLDGASSAEERGERPVQLALPATEPPIEVEGYTIHLPGFDGPMDLLLNLIEKNQLEITTISLVAVTDQFV